MCIHGFAELELRARFAVERRLSNVPGPACLSAVSRAPLAESSIRRLNIGSSRRDLQQAFRLIPDDIGME